MAAIFELKNRVNIKCIVTKIPFDYNYLLSAVVDLPPKIAAFSHAICADVSSIFKCVVWVRMKWQKLCPSHENRVYEVNKLTK